jgi:hypothetical protein
MHMAEPKVGADRLMAAGAPPRLAAQLHATFGDPQKVQGIFGGGKLLKLIGLLRQDVPTVLRIVSAVQAALASGDLMAIVTLVQTEGPGAWQILQDVMDIFGPAAPAAFEAGVSER